MRWAAIGALALVGFVPELRTGAPAPLQERLARTTTALRLRDAPSWRSTELLVIPRRARVTVRSCSDNWCRVTYRGVAGYASQFYLTEEIPLSGAVGGQGYTNSRGERVRSPTYSPDGPPAGATAQCRDGTYSFSRSRRGTCSHHGGVARWLY